MVSVISTASSTRKEELTDMKIYLIKSLLALRWNNVLTKVDILEGDILVT